MAKFHKRDSKGLSILKIALDLLKETCTFLFAITIGIINMVSEIIK